MRRAATQIANHQPHRRARPTDHDEERPEGFHKNMWQRLTGGQRCLVSPKVCQPEHLQHPGDNGRAVDPMSQKLPMADPIPSSEKQRFLQLSQPLMARMDQERKTTALAMSKL